MSPVSDNAKSNPATAVINPASAVRIQGIVEKKDFCSLMIPSTSRGWYFGDQSSLSPLLSSS
jgi:hypothetical protein